MIFIALAFSIFLMFLLSMLKELSKKQKNKRNADSIEAGFWSHSGHMMNFSVQFLGILLIFVMFDLEILFVSSLIIKYNLILGLLISFFISSTIFVELSMNSMKWHILKHSI